MIKVIIGTRAELIKMIPLIIECKDLEYEVLFTGQHDVDYILEKFDIKDKINYKYIIKPRKGFELNTREAIRFGIKTSFIIKNTLNKDDIIIVHGDTIATFSGSFAGFLKRIKTVHIEAGLRSWDPFEPFPEEIIRNIADYFSNILFPVSKASYINIKKQFPWKKDIYNVGNTINDSALLAYNLGKDINIPDEEYGLISIHRHENLKSKLRMAKIIKIIAETSKKIKLIMPLYDNTKKALEKYELLKYLENNKNIEIINPTDYITFIRYLSKSRILLTDGGSIQEESIIFRIPSILLRMKTERTEGLYTGINYLSKLNIKETMKKINEFLEERYNKNYENPYGKPGVSKKIIKIIKKYYL
ncbi:UDP-N-acetylglucosamine 2-epimerase [Nanobdella aerobiophila]|uniref:UDP-N-acetylglucosamine 2-epimerase n=1 Tax=Nanobdella aerobiophila TaxID=2586965 RepID=A0A915SZS9_9ARCH|nr:UDP-N-acetylglucosamine 2-epimerase (non-hydrolyzing) [Nanobdella aerobiophila]BBL45439.1 UDP-N-acetylglucosamine 2-epimerase [Nanobdella aerobiophila]